MAARANRCAVLETPTCSAWALVPARRAPRTARRFTRRFLERLARCVYYKRRNSIPLSLRQGKRHAGTRFSTASESALTLLVPRLDADNANSAIATNDLAVAAHFLYGSSNFHRSSPRLARATSRQPDSWRAKSRAARLSASCRRYRSLSGWTSSSPTRTGAT